MCGKGSTNCVVVAIIWVSRNPGLTLLTTNSHFNLTYVHTIQIRSLDSVCVCVCVCVVLCIAQRECVYVYVLEGEEDSQ